MFEAIEKIDVTQAYYNSMLRLFDQPNDLNRSLLEDKVKSYFAKHWLAIGDQQGRADSPLWCSLNGGIGLSETDLAAFLITEQSPRKTSIDVNRGIVAACYDVSLPWHVNFEDVQPRMTSAERYSFLQAIVRAALQWNLDDGSFPSLIEIGQFASAIMHGLGSEPESDRHLHASEIFKLYHHLVKDLTQLPPDSDDFGSMNVFERVWQILDGITLPSTKYGDEVVSQFDAVRQSLNAFGEEHKLKHGLWILDFKSDDRRTARAVQRMARLVRERQQFQRLGVGPS